MQPFLSNRSPTVDFNDHENPLECLSINTVLTLISRRVGHEEFAKVSAPIYIRKKENKNTFQGFVQIGLEMKFHLAENRGWKGVTWFF